MKYDPPSSYGAQTESTGHFVTLFHEIRFPEDFRTFNLKVNSVRIFFYIWNEANGFDKWI